MNAWHPPNGITHNILCPLVVYYAFIYNIVNHNPQNERLIKKLYCEHEKNKINVHHYGYFLIFNYFANNV